MKHILNNLSDEEKNSIREQHTGGMNVVTENFHRLLGSKLGDVKPLVSEQILPELSSGNSQMAVKRVFDSCRAIPVAVDDATNAIADSIYRAVQGLGTDEGLIIKTLASIPNLNKFCSANKSYIKTYGKDLYSDLDGDIDQEAVWSQISKVLRNLKPAPQVQTKPTGGGRAQRTGVKPTGGVPQKPGVKPTMAPKPTGGVPQKPGVKPTMIPKPTGGAQTTPQPALTPQQRQQQIVQNTQQRLQRRQQRRQQ
jgi:hypothetical protein